MLTVDKLRIYERFDGDIDGWARATRGQATPGMTDEDWYLIDELLVGLATVNAGAASPSYARQVRQRLLAGTSDEATRSILQAIAARRGLRTAATRGGPSCQTPGGESMERHSLSQEDRSFRSAIEACTVPPSQFNHEAHVRLAYVYLVESDVESAVQRMRETLLNFIERNGIPRSKFHETITRAWVLAVRHFMNRSSSTSFADFIAGNQELLDSRIMLTHYSASVLFSSEARASFVEPDLDPIPRQGTPSAPKGAT